ncbi:MAG: hypothetical protein AAF662_15940 [Pseudomonadota bacterium]
MSDFTSIIQKLLAMHLAPWGRECERSVALVANESSALGVRVAEPSVDLLSAAGLRAYSCAYSYVSPYVWPYIANCHSQLRPLRAAIHT